MRVTITARHIVVPENFKELLLEKLPKLEHFGYEILGLHAIFGKERYFYTAEITLKIKGSILAAKAKDERDLLTCVEEAMMKLKEQLRRHESKRAERRRRTSHRP